MYLVLPNSVWNCGFFFAFKRFCLDFCCVLPDCSNSIECPWGARCPERTWPYRGSVIYYQNGVLARLTTPSGTGKACALESKTWRVESILCNLSHTYCLLPCCWLLHRSRLPGRSQWRRGSWARHKPGSQAACDSSLCTFLGHGLKKNHAIFVINWCHRSWYLIIYPTQTCFYSRPLNNLRHQVFRVWHKEQGTKIPWFWYQVKIDQGNLTQGNQENQAICKAI